MGIKTQFSLQSDSIGESGKFNLYLKNHEIKQINSVLKHVLMLSKSDREEWILANGKIVQTAFDTFIDDSNIVLDNLSLDDEMMELSQDLVVSLKNAMEIVESILSDEQQLSS